MTPTKPKTMRDRAESYLSGDEDYHLWQESYRIERMDALEALLKETAEEAVKSRYSEKGMRYLLSVLASSDAIISKNGADNVLHVMSRFPVARFAPGWVEAVNAANFFLKNVKME